MRWLLDILHYSRDRESIGGIPLDLVFDTRRPCSPEPYDSHRKHSERKSSSSSSNGKANNAHIAQYAQLTFAPYHPYFPTVMHHATNTNQTVTSIK